VLRKSIDMWGGMRKLAKAYPLRRLGEPIDHANAILSWPPTGVLDHRPDHLR